jgi:hypothetical protein
MRSDEMNEDEHVRTKEDVEARRDPVRSGNEPELLIRPDERSGAEQGNSETVPVDDDERPWRRGIALTYRHKSVLAVPVDIQTAKLPRWRPRSVGDAGRASHDNE